MTVPMPSTPRMSPALIAVYPKISCRYRVRRNTSDVNVPNARRPARLPQAMLLRLSSSGATKGSATRFSTVKKRAKRPKATKIGPQVPALLQPIRPAASMPNTRVTSAAVIRIAPGTSSFGRLAAMGSRSTTGAITITARATATLMKNAHLHEIVPVSRPPKIAPPVKPAAMRAPLSPSAFDRAGPSGNIVVISDSAAGVTIAVANPCPIRATIISEVPWARPPAKEEMPSSTIPVRNRRLRPKRSAIRPKNSVNPAAHSAKAVTIHCSASVAKPRSWPMCGNATFNIEKSTARVKFAVRSTVIAIRCTAVKLSVICWWSVCSAAAFCCLAVCPSALGADRSATLLC